MDKNKKLHGNNARIDIEKHVTPRFENYVINDYEIEDGELISRLPDDADFTKKEVDDNKK